MEYKNLEKTIETLKTNPSKSSSRKSLGWIIGLILVGISITYSQCSQNRIQEIERRKQEAEYQQRQEKFNEKMRNLADESMERMMEERAMEREKQRYKSLRETGIFKQRSDYKQ